jgi:hypothetical protein
MRQRRIVDRITFALPAFDVIASASEVNQGRFNWIASSFHSTRWPRRASTFSRRKLRPSSVNTALDQTRGNHCRNFKSGLAGTKRLRRPLSSAFALRTESVHRIPRSTFVTTRNAPPDERGT